MGRVTDQRGRGKRSEDIQKMTMNGCEDRGGLPGIIGRRWQRSLCSVGYMTQFICPKACLENGSTATLQSQTACRCDGPARRTGAGAPGKEPKTFGATFGSNGRLGVLIGKFSAGVTTSLLPCEAVIPVESVLEFFCSCSVSSASVGVHNYEACQGRLCRVLAK